MLTRQELIDLGVPAGPDVGTVFKLLRSRNPATREDAIVLVDEFLSGTLDSAYAPRSRSDVIDGSALELLLLLPYFPSSQPKPGGCFASVSEKRRLLDGAAVEINGNRPKADDIISYPVESLVVFPAGVRRTTIR